MTTLYAVRTNTDLTEGRGAEYTLYLCELQATAIRLAKGGYVQGTDCPVYELDTHSINGVEYLPVNQVPIIRPADVDRQKEKKLFAYKIALKRARDAGLTDAEIAALHPPD